MTPSNTCAIFVTFNPDPDFSKHLSRVLSQFQFAIIVDNGSQSSAVEMLRSLADNPRVIVKANSSNLGIARALNQGVEIALLKQFEWIVTFDQDTCIGDDFFETIHGIYELTRGTQVMIGGNYWNTHAQQDYVQDMTGHTLFKERKTLITSGTLIPLSLFGKIGMFREDYFIDSVDHEFCLRARASGYRMLITCQPVMAHTIGSSSNRIRGGRLLLSFHHSARRKYYISRNTLFTARNYFLKEPMWCLRQAWRLLSDLASIVLLEDHKQKRILAFVVGLWHGVRGEMGPIEKTWPNAKF